MPHELEILHQYTDARVGLGRFGTGLPTSAVLEFRLAHAQARDAVLLPADFDELTSQLKHMGMPSIVLESRAADRQAYVFRPDLGRRLSEASLEQLKAMVVKRKLAENRPDLAIVICDGLSGAAIDGWAVELLRHYCILAGKTDLSFAPVAIVRNGRVAIGDEIGAVMHARMTVLLVGERPGLGSADSLGVYLTYAPKVGTTDEARNCISNIRASGLPPATAAYKLAWLVQEAMRRQLTGTGLKDEAPLSLSRQRPAVSSRPIPAP